MYVVARTALAVVLLGAAPPLAAQVTVSGITPELANATDVGFDPSVVDNSNPDLVFVEFGTDAGSGRARLEFARRATPFGVVGDAGPFSLGTLRHFNRPTLGRRAGAEDFAVDLNASLRVLGLATPFAETFQLFVENTPNECTPQPSCADDVFTFRQSGNAGRGLEIGGVRYFLNFVGFSQDGGTTILREFRSPEEGTNAADLYARLSTRSNVVPEPGTVALTLAGLGILAAVRRRARAA